MAKRIFTLINTTGGDLGPSSLILYLHQKGIPCDFIHASKPDGILYNQSELDIINNALFSSEIIGISSYSISEKRAFQLSSHIKKTFPDKHVILGGPNVIIDPDRTLLESTADSVCIHEGEIPLENLIKGYTKGSYTSISGLWFNKNSHIIKNDYQRPIQDLNEIPFRNYKKSHLGTYKKLTCQGLVNNQYLSEKIAHPFLRENILYIMTCRGCPNNCSYCINWQLKLINKKTNTKIIRKKSLEKVIKELKSVIIHEKKIDKIFFMDDDFFIRTEDELETFSKQYKREIKIPFFINATPRSITKRKINLCVEAGMKIIDLGIQSASKSVLTKYNRKMSPQLVSEAFEILYPLSATVDIWFDVITNSPFEDPSDILEMINYIKNLPGRFFLHVHSLHLFPGSKLWKEYGKCTGNESSEYQDYDNVLKNALFNPLHTKILFAMQGWHKHEGIQRKYGNLTEEELNDLIKFDHVKNNETIHHFLYKKILNTYTSKYYTRNYKQIYNSAVQHNYISKLEER